MQLVGIEVREVKKIFFIRHDDADKVGQPSGLTEIQAPVIVMVLIGICDHQIAAFFS